MRTHKTHLYVVSDEIARDVFGWACHKGSTVERLVWIPQHMFPQDAQQADNMV